MMSYLEQLREDARKQGYQAGYQEGYQAERVQSARDNLRLLLTTKFEHLPSEYANRIEAAAEHQLQRWLVRIVNAAPSKPSSPTNDPRRTREFPAAEQ
jgi:flagellar biosynthesis/type III secretory pathway protein FliH